MSSDDQHFLDVLSAIPTSILHYSSTITNTLERKLDDSALAWRERISSSSWLPEYLRPSSPPKPVPVVSFPHLHGHHGGNVMWRSYGWAVRWVDEHRALTAVVVAFVGTGGWLVYRRRKAYARKRRAKRGPGMARKEVVVVAGTPNSPLLWSIVLDLERRGFIIYVVVSSSMEEEMIKREKKPDIIPLNMNITDPFDVQTHLSNLTRTLQNPLTPAAAALTFTGLVLIPDLYFPTGPLETISASTWSDTLNTKLLHTILTTQAFLPLLRSNTTTTPHLNKPNHLTPTAPHILLLTPTILSSLTPAFHTPETTTLAALTAFAASLRPELATLNIPLVHLKLGTFDSANLPDRRNHVTRPPSPSLARLETLEWASEHRAAYARNYIQQSARGPLGGLFSSGSEDNATFGGGGAGSERGKKRRTDVKGTPIRELHNAVFDALTQPNPPGVWRVGRGSLVYESVGRWVPQGVVGWMMGLRREGGGRGGGGGWWERGGGGLWENMSRGGDVQGIGGTSVYG